MELNSQPKNTKDTEKIELIKSQITNPLFGNRLFFKDSVTSTNTWALESIDRGITEGAVFLADTQTAGRGRLGRTWESPTHDNILMSFIDRFESQLFPPTAPTLIAGLALAKALKKLDGKLPLTIKWPNDLLIEQKKVAGILCEKHPSLPYIVVGTGINIASAPTEPLLLTPATTVHEYSRHITTESLIASYLDYYYQYKELCTKINGWNKLMTEWKNFCPWLGHMITVREDNQLKTVRAIDLDKNGFLIIEDSGRTHPLISGDLCF